MNTTKRKAFPYLLLLIQAATLISSSCLSELSRSRLSPEENRFLLQVRYIITKEERKIFLEMPQEERVQFIHDFWEKRDPDPYTEENEFKDLYLSRLEEANRLFSAGKPGWLTDRGEIYVLFGPPTNIEAYPMGQGPGTRAGEIWYYGDFPIVFVDQDGSGDFVRVEDDVIYVHEINRALEAARMTLDFKQMAFDFKLKLKKEERGQVIVVEVPYTKIWFKSDHERLTTELRLELDVVDSRGQTIWDFKRDIPLQLTELEFLGKKDKLFIIRVPVELKKGKYTLRATLINQTGKEKRSKSLLLEI